jgi:hypothetical protein
VNVPLDDIVCLDFEASALGRLSYPIEVAVADCVTGACSGWLIRPTDAWLEKGVWSEEAAGVHNIPLDELKAAGRPVPEVADLLAVHCAGKRVLCDGGTHDRRWLTTLFAPLDIKPPFVLDDFRTFEWELAGLRARRGGPRPDLAIANSELEALTRFPPTHRAAADARLLAEILRLIAGAP